MVATAVLGAGALSAGSKIIGASDAADAQTQAAQDAIAEEQAMFGTAQHALKPYLNVGKQAASTLGSDLSSLTAPVTMDQNALMQTPGYQFTLSQGLKSTQNSAAARGLGVSGAAMKDASSYATGLADQTYQQQFQNAVTNKMNAYNMLEGTSGLGESAGSALAGAATTVGGQVAQQYTNTGNAQAAADNAIGSAIGGAANSAAGYYYGNSLMGRGY